MKDRKKTKGQALVELALTLPMLFMLALGAFDISHYLFTYDRMVSAAREAVRLATETQTTNFLTLEPAVRSRAQLVLTNSGIPWWTEGVRIGTTGIVATVSADGNNDSAQFMLLNITCPVSTFWGNFARYLGVTLPSDLTVSVMAFMANKPSFSIGTG